MSILEKIKHPIAITMWDFSWLERRWPGAGYENWDIVLDELQERGYDAVRIDAYPHLLKEKDHDFFTIVPCWNQNTWGTPADLIIEPKANFLKFVKKCRERKIWIGLSSWFQKDLEERNRTIISPAVHAAIWRNVLFLLQKEELLDSILYLDFCNEWPMKQWAPFYNTSSSEDLLFESDRSLEWISHSIRELKKDFPEIPMTFSSSGCPDFSQCSLKALQTMDFLEPHIWMVQANQGEYYKRVGYNFEKFDPVGYQNVVKNAEKIYRADPSYWLKQMEDLIHFAANQSKQVGLPLMTTECWGIVDYKDWPMLNWDWVKETCAYGTRVASNTGRWLGIASSNFCGPQFQGMWRDIDWHREMTKTIKGGELPNI